MSILVEALSVVIPRHVLDAGYPGGTEGYLDTARRARGARYALSDERLTCVSFATPAEVEAFTSPLDALGLTGEAGTPAPIACVDEDFGPTAPCPWLRWRRHGDGYTSCWLEWTEPGEMVAPNDWLPPRQRPAARVASRTIQDDAAMASVSREHAIPGPGRDPSVHDASAAVRRTAIGPLTPIGTPAIVAAATTSFNGSSAEAHHEPDAAPSGGTAILTTAAPAEELEDPTDPAPESRANMTGEEAYPAAQPLVGSAVPTPISDGGPADVDQAIADLDRAFARGLEEWSLPEFESDDTAARGDDSAVDPAASATVDIAIEAVGSETVADDEGGHDAVEDSEPTLADDPDPAAAAVQPGHERPVPTPGATAGDDPFEMAGVAVADHDSPDSPPATRLSDEAVDALFATWSDPSSPPPASPLGELDVERAEDPPSWQVDDDTDHEAVTPAAHPSDAPPTAINSSPSPSPSPSPAHMTALAAEPAVFVGPIQAVLAHLAECGWRHSQDADQQTVFYQAAGARASYPGFAAANEEVGLVWLYVQLPVRVPEHRRAAAVELLTRANHGLPVGNFEFDYADGEVRFKTVADSSEGCFSAAAAERLLHHAVEACDRYHDPLMQVIYGGLSPAEVLG